jgi:hypothetical protein
MTMKPKGEPLLAKQIDKATAELLMDLIDRSADHNLSYEERALCALQAGAILFTDHDDRRH